MGPVRSICKRKEFLRKKRGFKDPRQHKGPYRTPQAATIPPPPLRPEAAAMAGRCPLIFAVEFDVHGVGGKFHDDLFLSFGTGEEGVASAVAMWATVPRRREPEIHFIKISFEYFAPVSDLTQRSFPDVPLVNSMATFLPPRHKTRGKG